MKPSLLWRVRLRLIGALVLCGFGVAVTAQPATAIMTTPYGTPVRFYSETGHNLSGAFLTYYDKNGGLFVNGLPLTDEFAWQGMTVQVFERTIFERHNDNGSVYIARRLLGRDLTKDRDLSVPPFAPIANSLPDSPSRRFFPQTGHSLSNGFLSYWNSYGGLPTFGYALSEEFSEKNPADGQTYTVQYFERARFEYHPEHRGTPFEVQLGLLGKQIAFTLFDAARFAPAPNAAPGAQDAVIVPSLMYHHILYLGNRDDMNRFSTPPDLFVRELDWLQANGYHTVTTAQITDYLMYGIPLPSKPVNLRFDDGWSNQLWAAAEMRKRGMTATFFIPTRLMRGGLYMTIPQVQQLDADGFEVAAHTRTHDDLVQGPGDPVWEVGGSQDDLTALLGHPARSFAYPYGSVNAYAQSLVRGAKFDVGIGIDPGYVWRRSRMYNQPTISMENGWTLSHFIYLMSAAPTSTR